MAHIHVNTIVHAPVAEVTALAFDPHRWHTWFVGLTEPEEVEGNGEPGTVVNHGYLLAGIRFPVTTRVLRAEETEMMATWEATIEGPFDGRQLWTYKPVADGVQVDVQMDYTIPVVLLGKFADLLFIERIQKRSIEHTLENLKLLCEAVPV